MTKNTVSEKTVTNPDFPVQTIYRVHVTFLIPEKWRLGNEPCQMILDSTRARRNPIDIRIRVGEFPDVPNLLIIEGKNLDYVQAERDIVVNQIRSFTGYKFFKTAP